MKNKTETAGKSTGKSPNSLPVINIPQPCQMEWNELHQVSNAVSSGVSNGLSAADQKRFCDHCTKHVFNFAEMPRAEVQELVSSGASVCARVSRNADGSVVTLEDQPSRTHSSKFRSWMYRAALVVTGIASLVTFGGCDEETVKRYMPWLPDHEHEAQTLGELDVPAREMGDIAAPPILGSIEVPQPLKLEETEVLLP